MKKFNEQLEEVKTRISSATTVEEWNEIREELKKEFIADIITALDRSGFIKTLNLKKS